jgi:hypothetical protein
MEVEKNNNNITYIYYLHSGDNVPFYVGKSITPYKRRNEHVYKNNISSKDYFHIIDGVPESEWKYWEKFYIELFKSWGFILTNKNKGGGGPTEHLPTSKNKISQSLTGKIMSENTKKKMSDSAKGRKNTPEQKSKLSSSLQNYYSQNPGSFSGKKHTIDTINKICKPVIAMKDGVIVEEYASLKEAGVAHKSHSGNIIKYMKEGKLYHGMEWKYKK